MDLDIQKYLDRIGFKGKTEISLTCLTKLQQCHQSSVPFENLDIFTNRKKLLNHKLLYEQIVINNRGGWCHELNGLFSWLLSELGFDNQLIACQYFDQEKQKFNKLFGHMTIIVELEGQKYLTDVGLGNIQEPFEPLRIIDGIVQYQVCSDFKFSKSDGLWFLSLKERDVVGHHRFEKNKVGTDETWITLFKFDEMQRNLEDFQERCDEYQTKESGLSLSCVPEVMIRSADGGIVNCLIGSRFTAVRFQGNTDFRTNQLNLSCSEYNKILSETFGIILHDTLDISKLT